MSIPEIHVSELPRRWYRCAGLTIVSAVPLDDLAEPGRPGTPDVVIEYVGEGVADAFAAQTSHVLTLGEQGSPWLEVRRGAGGYLARWPEQMDVLIPDDGSRMQVCERGPVDDSVARLLLCQALSFVLAAHGREAMHASAVEIDGVAVVVSGDSGRGKSTLATALCKRGARLLADDLVSVRLDDEGQAVLDPTTTKTWLAHELATQMVGTDNAQELQRAHKVAVGSLPGAQGAVPLRAVYLLRYRRGESVVTGPLAPRDAVVSLLGALFNNVVRSTERLEMQFNVATQMAAGAPVYTLAWEPGPANAEEMADRMIAEVRSRAPRETVTLRAVEATPERAATAEPAAVVEPVPAPAKARTSARPQVDREQLLEILRAAGAPADLGESYDEPLLRTSQVAALLRSSDRTIRTWADAGRLPYIKTLGGRRLFPVSGVMTVLQSMHAHREEA